jgi:hypothetical protein
VADRFEFGHGKEAIRLKAVRLLGQRLEWYERLREEARDAFLDRICGSAIFTDKEAVRIMGGE